VGSTGRTSATSPDSRAGTSTVGGNGPPEPEPPDPFVHPEAFEPIQVRTQKTC